MLIFSVSFQFYRMIPEGNPSREAPNRICSDFPPLCWSPTSKDYVCCGLGVPMQMQTHTEPRCSCDCVVHGFGVSSSCKILQATAKPRSRHRKPGGGTVPLCAPHCSVADLAVKGAHRLGLSYSCAVTRARGANTQVCRQIFSERAPATRHVRAGAPQRDRT